MEDPIQTKIIGMGNLAETTINPRIIIVMPPIEEA